jgi:hypothetical protein
MHHRTALRVLILAILVDAALGVAYAASMSISVWDGLYYATGIATTSGNSPQTPVGWLPHALSMSMMCLVIPLFAAAFSLVTTGLTADHIDKRRRQTAPAPASRETAERLHNPGDPDL